MAFEQVTGTSRGREQRQMRTCLFVCVPSGGSRWTTGRYDRPSPEQLQWTGCVGPSVRTVCSASPTPWTRVGRRDDEPPRRPLDWYVANEVGYSGDVGGHPPPPDGDEPRGRRGPVGPLEQTPFSGRGRLAGESCVRLGGRVPGGRRGGGEGIGRPGQHGRCRQRKAGQRRDYAGLSPRHRGPARAEGEV